MSKKPSNLLHIESDEEDAHLPQPHANNTHDRFSSCKIAQNIFASPDSVPDYGYSQNEIQQKDVKNIT